MNLAKPETKKTTQETQASSGKENGANLTTAAQDQLQALLEQDSKWQKVQEASAEGRKQATVAENLPNMAPAATVLLRPVEPNPPHPSTIQF